MTVFLVLFRGINVGGNKIVRMEVLREALTKAGFDKVATYIQSGNVVLTSDKKASEVAALVAKQFEQAFGFSSRPTVRSLEQWRELIAGNPFVAEAKDHKTVSEVLLDETPADDAVERLRGFATTERIVPGEGVLYLHAPDGFGRSKVAEKLDATLKVPLTIRNWRTMLKLLDMAESTAN
ncbi:MAG: DUF1697 domain-containing protein [Salaquimonas sp.]|jgi:uncharacterized protein (DUF1697 family)|nr:DUF1697 domain-containing protein [Salaquimonas sp.]